MKAKIIAPLTVGLAVGALGGMLLAPHKGKVTRGKIKQSLEENKERLEEKAMEAQARANSAFKQAKKSRLFGSKS